MKANKFLALDFGASNGRAILGELNSNKIELEEIYRFPNRQLIGREACVGISVIFLIN